MEKKFPKAHRDKISDKAKDSWKDPTKRVEQKKRIEAKRLLKGKSPSRIESPGPLNIEAARQALIGEMRKLDEQLAKFEPLVQRRDKVSSILEELNNLRQEQS